MKINPWGSSQWKASGQALCAAIFMLPWIHLEPFLAAEPPKVSGFLSAQGTLLRLELRAAGQMTYAIEGSSDLKVWQPITNGQLNNGLLLSEQPVSNHHRFFRGREAGGSTNGGTLPLSVTPLVNTNLTATFLATTNGGSTVLYTADGTLLKVTIPPLNLPESEMITVTLVTNVSGLPFTGGIISAVRLEPDRLPLWGAGTLELTLPTGLDRRKVVSFAANGNGSSFHLTPDRVTAGSVIIPFTRLGLLGSALAATNELPHPGSNLRISAPASSNGGRLRMAVAACFPEEAANAAFYDEHLSVLTSEYSQAAAAALAAVRQSQLSGDSGDSFDYLVALERAEVNSCSLIRDEINPLLTGAESNCALAKVVVRHLLGIDRQRQLLGVAEDPNCPSSLGSLPLCAMMKNCLDQIKDCCELGIRGRQQVIAIYEIVRQEQLLGLDCLSTAEVDEAVDMCAPGKWTGTLTLKVRGEESESDPSSGRSALTKITEEFQGQVTDALEFAFGETTSVSLTVEGQMSFQEEETLIITGGSDCGGFFHHNYETQVATGSVIFGVLFTISPGAPPAVTITANPERSARGRETDNTYERSGSYILTDHGRECSVRTSNESNTQEFTHLSISSIFGAPATFQTNTVSGVASISRGQLRIDGEGMFEWTFERHPERQ